MLLQLMTHKNCNSLIILPFAFYDYENVARALKEELKVRPALDALWHFSGENSSRFSPSIFIYHCSRAANL
jgi:hypothetical protein